jgi:hypothetical protein
MNRRHFLSCASLLAVLPLSGNASADLPRVPMLQRKYIGPNAVEVSFSGSRKDQLLQLRSKRNALWIESVAWEDQEGFRRVVPIRKNLPPGKNMPLPMISSARSICLTITCLPLTSATTLVELHDGI